MKPIRVAVVLPGLGRVQRGAETAFIEVAKELSNFDDVDVKLFGSSTIVPEGLDICAVECTPREKFESFPRFPMFRSECHYEEFSYVERLWRSGEFNPLDFDVTLSCTFPWVNWFLQRAKRKNPDLVNLFVTQNGDWMCRAGHREFRYFGADGVVTINPEYYENNREQHRTRLIPNGTDPDIFFPRNEDTPENEVGLSEPLPTDKKIILMVSALIDSKRVEAGVRAAAQVEDAYFVVAGDGPERERIKAVAEELMPGRYRLLGSLDRDKMPALFRSADVFLHMSQIEPFGIVYLEAAASGLAVVTHDRDTPRWILGETALFADSNNPEEVANAIRMACNGEFGKALGQSARKRVIQDWTWKAQAAKYREFILELRQQQSEGDEDAVDYHRKLQHA